jgi:hypothetical protein
MGLSICLGVLDKRDTWDDDVDGETIRNFRRSFRRLNTFLRRKGLPPHHEPERPPEMSPYDPYAGLRYWQLHCLRRFAANHYANPGRLPRPIKRIEDSRGDPELRKYYDGHPEGDAARSHLIHHSDCNGLYIPIDFPRVLFDPTGRYVEGNLLGSSVRLLEELRELAGPLGMRLWRGRVTKKDLAALDKEGDDPGPYYVERSTWAVLLSHAELSVRHKTAIMFM